MVIVVIYEGIPKVLQHDTDGIIESILIPRIVFMPFSKIAEIPMVVLAWVTHATEAGYEISPHLYPLKVYYNPYS